MGKHNYERRFGLENLPREKAKQLYKNYTATRNKTLSTIIKEIDNLVDTAYGEHRQGMPKSIFDTKKNNALHAALPPKSQIIASTLFRRYRNDNCLRYPTYQEYCQMLMRESCVINDDIRNNGKDPIGFEPCTFGYCKKFFRDICVIEYHRSPNSGLTYPIESTIRCTDRYVIYKICCGKCKETFICSTTQPVYKSLAQQYMNVVKKNVKNAETNHFIIQPGHSVHDVIFVPFEKIRDQNKSELKRRLDYWKGLLGTSYNHIYMKLK